MAPHKERRTYYVYLLLTAPVAQTSGDTTFDPSKVLYVGKGKGHRWRQHFDRAAATPGKKSEAILAALGSDPTPDLVEQHAVIVAGDLTEAEAFRLEAIMMHLVGFDELTNLVAGHASGGLMVPAYDARVFFGAEDLDVDVYNVKGTGTRQADLLRGAQQGAVMFAVKGTSQSLEEPQWRPTSDTGRFPNSTLMTRTDEAPTVRRGWDPQNPWSQDEATARARRYWAASPDSVKLWQQLIRDRGGYLALLVSDPRDGRSVVRYVWALDPSGAWEDYGDRFGFPIGTAVADHPWLGKRLLNRRTGRAILQSPNAPAVMTWTPTASHLYGTTGDA